MKKSYLAAIIVLTLNLTGCAKQPVDSEQTTVLNHNHPAITVTETRLENGDSTIKVVNDISGITKNYKINMSKHHYPAISTDDPLVKKFTSWKFGAFLCYNLNQYTGEEIEWTDPDPVGTFNPTNLDVVQWVTTIKDAGMKYAVLTVRHTSELLLWDSVTSEVKVTNTSYKRDLVQEYVDECRQQGIAVGLYYCLWGGSFRPDPNARAVILAQLHELATQYGDIDYFWLDMPSHIKWLTPDLTEQEIYDSLKNANPEAIVMFNHSIQDGKIAVFPSDVANGEMHGPPVEGHNPWRTVGDKKYYVPFEYEPCSQKRGTTEDNFGPWDYPGVSWFTYGSGQGFESSKSFSAQFLYERLNRAYQRGAGNVLLACAPDHTGAFRQADIDELVKLGNMLRGTPTKSVAIGCSATASSTWDSNYQASYAFDGDVDTRWGAGAGTTSGWLEVDLGQNRTFSRVEIEEGWQRVTSFQLQTKTTPGGSWQTIYQGTIGMDFSADFNKVTARYVRLNILDATDAPTIWEVRLYDPEPS